MIRLKFIIFGALGLQIMAVGSQDVTLTRAAMLFTYPLLIIVALVNWRLQGMKLILVGALLNFIVMVANGGLMPVSAATVVRVSGQGAIENLSAGEAVPGSKSVIMSEDQMVLGAFADRFVVDLPIVASKVFSVGDLLIGAGLVIATGQLLSSTASSVRHANRHE